MTQIHTKTVEVADFPSNPLAIHHHFDCLLRKS